MELLTDILAIAGWALFGFILPVLIEIRIGQCTGNAYTSLYVFASFGLIAASLVLG